MKRTISKFPLIVLFVFISLQTYSQKQYKPGFIITNDMEKIEGEVEILSDIFNAQYVNFNDGNTLIRYTPEQVNSWGIEDNRIFVSKTIIEDEEEKAVFLEYIVKGYTSLLTYTAENQEIRYFIQKEDDRIRELKMGRRVNEEGKEVVYQEYLGVLRILFDDCEEIKEQIPSTAFRLSSFTKIVKNYNNCINPGEAFFERKIKKENFIGFEFLIGYNFPDFSITKNDKEAPYHYLEETTVESKSYISGSLNIIFSVPKVKGVSANLGVMYGKWKYDAVHEHDLNPPQEMERIIYTYNYSVITIPLMVRYTFDLNKFKPFVNVGYSYSIIPKNNMKMTNELHNIDGSVVVYNSEPNFVFKSRHGGLEGGIGLKYELLKFADIHFEIRYQQGKSDGFPGDATTPDISFLTLKSNMIYIMLGLSF